MCSNDHQLLKSGEQSENGQSEKLGAPKNQFVEINCSTVVELYSKSMCGVDLLEMLIYLYRTPIRIKRWYLKVLSHCVDIAKNNA